jgi:hypothetical protein
MSPPHVIEVVSDADEAGLIIEGVFWTADGSVLISRSSIPDFLAQDTRGQHGWLNAVWTAKLEVSRSIGNGSNGRNDESRGMEDQQAKAGQATVECKLCKILMHWVVIPLLAALLAGVCLDVVSRYHGITRDDQGLSVPAEAARLPDLKHR